MPTSNEFQTLAAENRKARDPKIGCDGEQKADENWMSAETSQVHGSARGQRDMADDQCARQLNTHVEQTTLTNSGICRRS